jgi:hypothetical protein
MRLPAFRPGRVGLIALLCVSLSSLDASSSPQSHSSFASSVLTMGAAGAYRGIINSAGCSSLFLEPVYKERSNGDRFALQQGTCRRQG